MSMAWLVGGLPWALAGLLGTGVAPDPNDPDPDPDPELPDPNEPDPPDPDPPPEPPEPDPPPPPEPVPTEGNPEPEPGNGGGGGGGGGGGDGTVEPGGNGEEPGGGGGASDAAEVTPAPFAQLDVADRESELDLGGDLTIGPRCKDDRPNACDNFRVGLRLRLPVTQASTSGTGRAAIDSLNGFGGAWRVGGVFDWIRDVTAEDVEGDEPSPAKFYMLSLQAAWGVQTFQFSPDAGATAERKETRHSIHTLARFLAYVHPPRKTRVAPQLLVRYDRQWSSADPVGVFVDDGDPDTPMFTVPVIIDSPVTAPVFAVTVPVLVSVQSGKGRAGRVLSQLGFGPAVSYAAAGKTRGYTPFDDLHVVRFESWIYWYPLGKSAQLAATKPNARIGVSPFVDVFAAGRAPGQPTVDFGVLAEVKVGVRGYEY